MDKHSEFIETKIGTLIGSWQPSEARQMASAVRGRRLRDAVDKQFVDALVVMGFNSTWDLVTLLAYQRLSEFASESRHDVRAS